jgi:hypothetical protein
MASGNDFPTLVNTVLSQEGFPYDKEISMLFLLFYYYYYYLLCHLLLRLDNMGQYILF